MLQKEMPVWSELKQHYSPVLSVMYYAGIFIKWQQLDWNSEKRYSIDTQGLLIVPQNNRTLPPTCLQQYHIRLKQSYLQNNGDSVLIPIHCLFWYHVTVPPSTSTDFKVLRCCILCDVFNVAQFREVGQTIYEESQYHEGDPLRILIEGLNYKVSFTLPWSAGWHC